MGRFVTKLYRKAASFGSDFLTSKPPVDPDRRDEAHRTYRSDLQKIVLWIANLPVKLRAKAHQKATDAGDEQDDRQ